MPGPLEPHEGHSDRIAFCCGHLVGLMTETNVSLPSSRRRTQVRQPKVGSADSGSSGGCIEPPLYGNRTSAAP